MPRDVKLTKGNQRLFAFNLALTVVGAFCLGEIAMSKELGQEKA